MASEALRNRADVLWGEELARVEAARSAMSPATKAAVRSVLESLVGEDGIDPYIAADARWVLDALLERPAPRTPPQRLGLSAARLRAI
jgi:hypothetical protein